MFLRIVFVHDGSAVSQQALCEGAALAMGLKSSISVSGRASAAAARLPGRRNCSNWTDPV